MRSGDRPQIVGQFDRACDASAEADAVVRARYVVVHRLGNRENLDPFLVQSLSIAQRIVTPDRNQVVDVQKLEILQDGRSYVIDVIRVLFLQMRRDDTSREVTWPTRCVPSVFRWFAPPN